MIIPLNSYQQHLIQISFQKVIDNVDLTASIFYDYLFEHDPSLKSLFKEDKQVQGRKLMRMLLMLVNNLDNPETLTKELRALGHRHVDYQVRPEFFPKLGRALFHTVEQVMGDDFTTDMAQAWQALYNVLQTFIIQHTFSRAG